MRTVLLSCLLAVAGAARAAEPRVATDARADLVGLVELLSGDPFAPDDAFARATRARFAPWRGHPAVKTIAALSARGLDRGVPAQYALYLSSPPALDEVVAPPRFFADTFGGPDALEAWRRDLADFARASGFLEWREKTRAEREAFAARVRAAQGGRDLGAPLERLLGARTWGDWVVYASPLFPPGGGDSWIVEQKPGLPDVVVLYGPTGGRGESGGGSPDEFASGVLPEAVFTMTYVLFEACRPAHDLVSDACAGLPGLSRAEDCVQQHWVRELVARLVAAEFGAAAEARYRAAWKPSPRADAARAAVAAYARDRARYPDLLDADAELTAPFQKDGRAPACRTIDPARFGEEVYPRRLAYYLQGRLRRRPDAALAQTLSDLRARLDSSR